MARVTAEARKKVSTVDPEGPLPPTLAKVQSAIERYEASREAVDAAVLKARSQGFVFHEIANAAGRSVSWVQSVIYRSDDEAIQYQDRSECPVCGKDVAKSWYQRHIRTEHPDVEVVVTHEVVRKPVPVG